MKQPLHWKSLKRHPLSEDYPDLEGPIWDAFLANLKEHGVVGGRKITLHEGKVLDGWQLYRGCLLAGIKPVFQAVPKGMTPEQWVETCNDLHRQDTQEMTLLRIKQRRERVAASRAEGQSTRQIAETEGVSQTQVMSDLKAITEQGCSVTPESGKVTGKDGREQPATRPQTRAERVGQKPPTPFVMPNERGEREPGDDTESEAAAAGRQARNGAPAYDLHSFEDVFGRMIRQIDLAGKPHGKHNSPTADRLRNLLMAFKDEFKGWIKTLKVRK